MKKLLILLVVFSLSCKKKNKDPEPTPEPTPVATEVYCIYEVLDKGQKKFLECVSTSDKKTDAIIKYRNQGIEATSVKVVDCKDC